VQNTHDPSVPDWPVSGICEEPVRVETNKTDEVGHAVHEECYLLKVKLHRATSVGIGRLVRRLRPPDSSAGH
jgi:hypothetical protein